MFVFLFLIVTISFQLSFAVDASSIACDSLKSLGSQDSELMKNRSEVQNFLKNSGDYIQGKIESQDFDAIAVACGLIDDVTMGFTKPCLDDTDAVIDLTQAQKACETQRNR
jgi:hypothetical protein